VRAGANGKEKTAMGAWSEMHRMYRDGESLPGRRMS